MKTSTGEKSSDFGEDARIPPFSINVYSSNMLNFITDI